MSRRASRTCYFLNRRAGYLALIGSDVQLPASIGVWVPIANPDLSPRQLIELLDSIYPTLDAGGLSFVSLLTDFEVEEFERDLERRDLLRSRKGREG